MNRYLSLASLSYAKRQTEALGLRNIEYAQADILELGTLDRMFDTIVSTGVLHHMAAPEAGLSALLSTVEQIKASVNPDLEIEGILRTMFDPRNNLANEVSAQLIMHFGDKVFRTIIPRNVRLAEAPSFGKPVLQHDKDPRGALAYLALAGEMLRKEDDAGAEPEIAPPPDGTAEGEHPLN